MLANGDTSKNGGADHKENGDQAITASVSTPSKQASDGAKNKPFLSKQLSIGSVFNIFGLWNKDRDLYTPGQIEQELYDPKVGIVTCNLLNIEEIIPPDRRKGASEGIIRFIKRRAVVIDCIGYLTILASCLVAPLTSTWNGTIDEPNLIPGGMALFYADCMIDMMFMAYLLILLRMSYLHPTRHVEVMSSAAIMKFWWEKPIYWCWWISTLVDPLLLLGLPLTLNLVKVCRTVKLLALPDSMWRMRDSPLVRMSKPLLLLILGAHYVACILFCFGGYREAFLFGGDEDMYATSYEGSDWQLTVSPDVSMYLMAFVEALYMLTGALDNPVGDGGPRERKFGSLIIVAVFGPIGCIVIALLISSVVQEMTMARALEMRHEHNKAFMSRALQILNIPKPLQRRVLSMQSYQVMCHDIEAFSELFDKRRLSAALENALLVYLHQDTVCNASYFLKKDSSYIVEVLRELKFQVYLPGDYVTRRGEVASTMFFVNKGYLSVLVPGSVLPDQEVRVVDAIHVGTISPGDHFGEVALFQASMRTAWVRTDGYSVLSALHRDAIDRIWSHFPKEREELQLKVQKINEADRRRNAGNKLRNVVKKMPKGMQDSSEDMAELGTSDITEESAKRSVLRQSMMERASSPTQAGSPRGDDMSAMVKRIFMMLSEVSGRVERIEDYISKQTSRGSPREGHGSRERRRGRNPSTRSQPISMASTTTTEVRDILLDDQLQDTESLQIPDGKADGASVVAAKDKKSDKSGRERRKLDPAQAGNRGRREGADNATASGTVSRRSPRPDKADGSRTPRRLRTVPTAPTTEGAVEDKRRKPDVVPDMLTNESIEAAEGGTISDGTGSLEGDPSPKSSKSLTKSKVKKERSRGNGRGRE